MMKAVLRYGSEALICCAFAWYGYAWLYFVLAIACSAALAVSRQRSRCREEVSNDHQA